MKSFKKTLLILFSIELLFSQLQLGTDLDGEASGDLYGSSVSMDSDGDRVAIGGLGWLAVLGGALAYKKLRNKK